MTSDSGFQLAGKILPPASAPAQRVYVIDDHREVRASVSMLLGTFGVATCAFSSAHSFIEKLPTLIPAPLLLDITMPGISGIELLETLAARKIHWPVLIMTGLTDVPVVYRALALGAMNVLEKPFSAEALDSAVMAALATMADPDMLPPQEPLDAAR